MAVVFYVKTSFFVSFIVRMEFFNYNDKRLYKWDMRQYSLVE